MSLIPSTSNVLRPSSSSPVSAADSLSARSGVGVQNPTGGFSEVLSRSLKSASPAGNKTDAQTDKADGKTFATKRTTDKLKNNTEDMLNTLSAGWMPLQSLNSLTVALGGAAQEAGSARPENLSASALALPTPTALTPLGPSSVLNAPLAALTDDADGSGTQPSLGVEKPAFDAVEATNAMALTAGFLNVDSGFNAQRLAALTALLPLALPGEVAPALSSSAAPKFSTANIDAPIVTAATTSGFALGTTAQGGLASDNKPQGETGQRNTRPAIDSANRFGLKNDPKLSVDAPLVNGALVAAASKEATDSVASNAVALAQPQALTSMQIASSVIVAKPADFTSSQLTGFDIGSSQWGKALGHQVLFLSQNGSQVAELQLNPPGMGPLKVTLSMNDQQMQATFVTNHESVRAAVESALPQLRATLADSGINLAATTVSSGSQQQTAFNERAGEQPHQKRGSNQYEQSRSGLSSDEISDSIRKTNLTSPARGLGIDTYA